jgi:fructose-1,6-bisphosphatase/inositol monophosphatase family enzyme
LSEPPLRELLQAAVDAALAGAEPIRRYYRADDIGLVAKSDGSPVTLADREAEAVIRGRLAAAPGGPFDILGEEEGLSGGGSRWRWVVDPIDGTRSFVRGIPLFGSMIGLEDTADGSALLGVIHLPVLGVTYAGARGLGATRNGRPIRLPEAVALEDSIVGTGDIAQFNEAGLRAIYECLTGLHGYVRTYTDCFGHGLTIEGALGAMVEPALNPWDIRATQAIVEAAGGAAMLRSSRAPGKFDALFGNRALVAQLARELGFEPD